jgi:V8-like Glu-specific endopeptidase
MGHACPVTINSAMTAGHVTADTLESGEQVKHYYRGESGSWEGFLDWKLTSTYEDAGVLAREESSAPFVPYELALRRPAVGEQLWWMGYDWRTGPAALDRRIFTGKVQSVRAGSIVLDVPTPQGSSGSCVLDSSGKVVGVISWGIEQADGKEVAIAVGLFPPYFNGLSKE